MTPEEARGRLEAALMDYIQSTDSFHGEALGDWVVVAHLPMVEDPASSTYFVGYHSEYVPRHVAAGLLTEALGAIDGGGD